MSIDKSLPKRLRESTIIKHPNFMQVHNDILAHIEFGSSGQVLNIIGPTGVGKSTLMKYCAHKLTEHVEKHPDCGFGPPLMLEAHAPENGYFSWRTFYTAGLRRLAEPAIAKKIRIDNAIAQLKAGELPVAINNRVSAPDLRLLFEERLEHRRPIVVFIDESQSLAKARSELGKEGNLEVIKSLSNSGITNYVLFGTCAARQMLYHGGQLSRRVEIIHFQRYRSNDKQIAIFESILQGIMTELALPISKDVTDDLRYLYNHSLGCFGILMTWISKALELGIKRSLNIVTRKELERARLQNIQLSSIAREIMQYEYEHRNQGPFDPDVLYTKFIEGRSCKSPNTPSVTGNRKPGKRNPGRDPVGKRAEEPV